MTDEYPKTFDNGGGERLTFTRRIAEPDGDRVVGDNVVSPGAGPPMHVHYLQEEGLTVVHGTLGYQRLGGEPRLAAAGETVVFKAGEAHRFWNAGEGELRCTAYIKPAGNAEFFLGALFEAQKKNGGKPGIFEAAFLLHRYRSEFALLGVPTVVRRFAFPVLVRLGKALGKYDKWADAPEPIRVA